MFARSGTRLAGLLWDSVDLAVEFATLGEYRLPEREESSVHGTTELHGSLAVPVPQGARGGQRARRGVRAVRESGGAVPWAGRCPEDARRPSPRFSLRSPVARRDARARLGAI